MSSLSPARPSLTRVKSSSSVRPKNNNVGGSDSNNRPSSACLTVDNGGGRGHSKSSSNLSKSVSNSKLGGSNSPNLERKQSQNKSQANSSNRLAQGLPSLPGSHTKLNNDHPFIFDDTPLERNPEDLTTDHFAIFKRISTGIVTRTYLTALERDFSKHFTTTSFESDGNLGDNHDLKLYAVKVLHKSDARKMNLENRFIKERELLIHLRHPYICKYLCSFTDHKNMYIATQYGYCTMRQYLRKQELQERTMNEETARFYISELVVALEYIHSKDVILGDLKPDSILIDDSGHIRLCDYSQATYVGHILDIPNDSPNDEIKAISNPNIHTRILWTLGYAAPELLNYEQPTKRVDWWSVGIILYEFLSNELPYPRSENPAHYQDSINFPSSFSASSKDLIRRLLHNNPQERLGSWHDAVDLKCHSWFSSIKRWTSVEEARIQPPFLPSKEHEKRLILSLKDEPWRRQKGFDEDEDDWEKDSDARRASTKPNATNTRDSRSASRR